MNMITKSILMNHWVAPAFVVKVKKAEERPSAFCRRRTGHAAYFYTTHTAPRHRFSGHELRRNKRFTLAEEV